MMHFIRFIIIQCVLVAGLVALYLTGFLAKPFEGEARWFSAAVLALAGVGLCFIVARRFEAAAWLSVRLIRVAIVGMQIGCISALTTVSASVIGGADIMRVMAIFLGAIGIAFYVSLCAMLSNLWLDLNLKLLGGEDAGE